MDIERLKELVQAEDSDLWDYKVELIGLLDEAIARQSVKSEEVAEAIGDLLDMKERWCADSTDNDAISIDLAITALQAYEPWVSVSERLPESGKHVLLCCEITSGKRYVCDGYYAQSKTITAICDDDNNCEYDEEIDEYYLIEGYYQIINNCEYDEETDEYYLIEGYYEIINNCDYYSSIAIEDFVTHWKPLPEPPKGE